MHSSLFITLRCCGGVGLTTTTTTACTRPSLAASPECPAATLRIAAFTFKRWINYTSHSIYWVGRCVQLYCEHKAWQSCLVSGNGLVCGATLTLLTITSVWCHPVHHYWPLPTSGAQGKLRRRRRRRRRTGQGGTECALIKFETQTNLSVVASLVSWPLHISLLIIAETKIQSYNRRTY